LKPTNPYGRTKLVGEQILRDLEISDPSMRIAYLRYFNPIGAHHSGLIGEDSAGIPNNIAPILVKVAMGKLPELQIFGNDWPTPDGTGVRDYIHVVDLAKAHVKAIDYLRNGNFSLTVNLGTGKGYSVMDLIKTFEKVIGKSIPYRIGGRRPGDIAICFANANLAEACLGWRAEYDLVRMCEDAWRWQSQNPDGYLI
jgi:UDP-glucose 4-epimerase